MIAIEDLITPITEDQFVEHFLTTLESVGLAARSWRPGGVYRTILRVLAATCASFSDLQVRFIRSGFLELAEGDWLTFVAYYVYGVSRPESTFAVGPVTLTNSGGGDYTFTAGQFRVFNTALNKTFKNVGVIALAPMSTATGDFVAVEIGSGSSSAATTIDGVETMYDGQIAVSNAAPILGSDAMADADLRQLCKDSLGARSVFGPRGAYRYAIRTALRNDGSPVDINRMSISPGSSTGIVTVYVASPSGVPTGDDVTAVIANIEALARPDTATVLTTAVTGVTITRALTIWAEKQEGLSAADLVAFADAAIVRLNRDYPIGGIRKATSQGYFYADKLEGVVQGSHPAIYDIEDTGADVALDPGEIAVLAVTIAAVNIVDTEVH